MKKIETERKFVIKKPDMKTLEMQSNFTSSKITQIYITDSDKTHRIRKRIWKNGEVEYTENTKQRISPMSSIESEKEIDEKEFERLSQFIEIGSHPVLKTRVTFEFISKTFEIDIYPEWERSSVLEVELDREDEEIIFPEFVKIIKEVTGKSEFSNHRMAYEFPTEIICDD